VGVPGVCVAGLGDSSARRAKSTGAADVVFEDGLGMAAKAERGRALPCSGPLPLVAKNDIKTYQDVNEMSTTSI
jgi:hypothetical protein